VPLGVRQIQDDYPYDGEDEYMFFLDYGEDNNEDGSDDSMMGIRIPYEFRKKDMAYILFHNDDIYSLLFLDSCFHLLF
jgi:hypothetical protein